MSESEFSEQIKLMGRNLQRMRLAIIVIAAFFVYEAIGPLSFGEDRVEIQETIKARSLFIVDDRGQTIAYLGADGDSAGLILDDAAGNRLDARPDAIKLMASPKSGERIERLQVQGNGVTVYDEDGYVAGLFPKN